MILSRNSFADLKTGIASPTIALAAPTASIGGRGGRVDWESRWGCTELRWERASKGIDSGQFPARLSENSGSVDSERMLGLAGCGPRP